MKYGFTGSRDGFTQHQMAAFSGWTEGKPFTEFHNGLCVGADAASAQFVYMYTIGQSKVIGHPSNLQGMTDKQALRICEEVRDALPPLERNRVIVDSCEVLLAAPKGPEELRSGTWSTIRYARRIGRPVVIFWPDGRVEDSRD